MICIANRKKTSSGSTCCGTSWNPEMKRLLPFLVLAASCSGGHRFEQPALVSLLGPEASLETWDAQVVEGAHLHPREGAACQAVAGLMEAGVRLSGDPRTRALAETVAGLLEETMTLSLGPAYGGPGRLALALRRYAPGEDLSRGALAVAVPALAEGQEERSYEGPDIAAGYHEFPPGIEAELERGRVGVRRLGPGRFEITLFLVLRPVPPRAPHERLQVVTRVEAGPGDIR